ncbi:MAG: DUF1593 domain-containing protein [Anaerolineae bacterium]|nr:DUF1593 domain-containing protein [Anaerolineae bacterium]
MNIQAHDQSAQAPRVIVMTDFPPINVIPGSTFIEGEPPEMYSDPDDVQSMIRLLLYTNDLDVEALIASAGSLANIARKKNILDLLDVYEQVQPNLAKHDPSYPTADALRAITWQGLDGSWGSPHFGRPGLLVDNMLGAGKDTEASEAIIRIVDKPDDRLVWVCVWGGSCELGQAIWKVQHSRSAIELAHFLSKLRIFLIGRQDNTADWMLDNFPNLFVITSEKNYKGMFWNAPGADHSLADLPWANDNLRQGHGPLGAVYPRSGWNHELPGVWEGDTPSYLHLLSAVRGVNDPEKPDQGGWGGKFVQPDPAKKHWWDDPIGPEAVYKWRPDVQADLADRADWMLP